MLTQKFLSLLISKSKEITRVFSFLKYTEYNMINYLRLQWNGGLKSEIFKSILLDVCHDWSKY